MISLFNKPIPPAAAYWLARWRWRWLQAGLARLLLALRQRRRKLARRLLRLLSAALLAFSLGLPLLAPGQTAPRISPLVTFYNDGLSPGQPGQAGEKSTFNVTSRREPGWPEIIDLGTLGSDGEIIFGMNGGDWSGSPVSNAGDVNGDGYDDLLIGASGGDGPADSRLDAGESYLLFGASTPPASLDLAALGPAGVVLYGADSGDRSGLSVSGAGDVNGDGYDDLLIGAYRADGPAGSRSLAGESYLVFGGASLPASIDLAALGSAGVTLFGANNDDFSGRSVSGAGNVNGDGYDDFLIRAPGGDGPAESRPNAGESYLVLGGSSLPATIDLGALGPAGMTVFDVELFSQTGRSVGGAGDVNGDGYDDFLIGESDGYDAGTSYLLFGSSAPPATIDLNMAGVTLAGVNDYDNSGWSLNGAGDVNGDGYDDLLVGAPGADGPAESRPGAGESYLVFGGPALPPTVNLGTLDPAGVTLFGVNNGDGSGWSVSNAGDVNGDGYGDLLVGARGAGGPANSRPQAGESYLLFGGPAWPATIDLGTLGPAGVTLYGASSGDFSGVSVSGAGDVNGDGLADLLIGAYTADGPADSRLDAGESYLVLGRPDTMPGTATPTPTPSSTPSTTPTATPTPSVTPTAAPSQTPSPTPTSPGPPVRRLYLPVLRR
ncbi:MAG: integrin alpha [Chloroflexi bacterium]|nr:integrin alpha [Chloroflexota bacterium]